MSLDDKTNEHPGVKRAVGIGKFWLCLTLPKVTSGRHFANLLSCGPPRDALDHGGTWNQCLDYSPRLRIREEGGALVCQGTARVFCGASTFALSLSEPERFASAMPIRVRLIAMRSVS